MKVVCDKCGAQFDKGPTCPNCGSHVIESWTGEVETVDLMKYFDKDGKFVPMFLAEDLMKKYHFITMIDSREVYAYIDGYYQPVGEVLIKRESKNRLQGEYRRNRFGEVFDYIKASTFTKRREEPPNLIPVRNGVLDIDTMVLKEYSPELMFFNKIPVEYNPMARCPKIKQFHGELVNGDGETRILEEVIGFCLYREYFVAKALMLVGGGENGKSTWLGLVKALLGHDNVSGRGLQELEENRFAKASLYTKLANVFADLPDKALQRTGMFKMLTGRDLIAAEKKFQNAFHFVNYAKLLFSANKVPEAMDDTDAFFRRWIIITFPNVFSGENCDPHILKKLSTDEELSGLLNTAVARLKELIARGTFSYSKTTDALREEYKRKSSPIAAFVMDFLETDSDAFIVKKELYATFADYCRQSAIPCVTQDTFYKNLPQHVVIADFRPRVEGRRYHTFKGVRYGSAVSTLSSVSRAFYILIERGEEFGAPWETKRLDDPSYIKIGIALDSLDSLDTGGEEAPSKDKGGLDGYTDTPVPSPECPPIPPSPPNNASLSEDLLVVVEVLKGLQRQANGDPVKTEDWRDALSWGEVRFSSVLGIAKRDGKVFQPSPGFWRATI